MHFLAVLEVFATATTRANVPITSQWLLSSSTCLLVLKEK
jgi:hypothetical protein